MNMNTPQSNFSPWLRQSMPAFLILAAIGVAMSLAEAPPEGPFLAENEAAMTKMMTGMQEQHRLMASGRPFRHGPAVLALSFDLVLVAQPRTLSAARKFARRRH